jgi:hypothetical protein
MKTFLKTCFEFSKKIIKLGMSIDEIARHMHTKIQVQTHCILKDTKREIRDARKERQNIVLYFFPFVSCFAIFVSYKLRTHWI